MKKIFFLIGILAVMVGASVAHTEEVQVNKYGRIRSVPPTFPKVQVSEKDLPTVLEHKAEGGDAFLAPGTKIPICDSRKEKDGLWHYVTIQECSKTILYDEVENKFVVETTGEPEKRERKFNPLLMLLALAVLAMIMLNMASGRVLSAVFAFSTICFTFGLIAISVQLGNALVICLAVVATIFALSAFFTAAVLQERKLAQKFSLGCFFALMAMTIAYYMT